MNAAEQKELSEVAAEARRKQEEKRKDREKAIAEARDLLEDPDCTGLEIMRAARNLRATEINNRWVSLNEPGAVIWQALVRRIDTMVLKDAIGRATGELIARERIKD